MSHFFAEFDRCGSAPCVIRKDTRVYYHPQTFSPGLQRMKRCVGVIWMCNPGSAARPTGPIPWGVIQPDQTLRAVGDLYRKAVAAKADPQQLPGPNDYLQILNGYYAVGPDFAAAYVDWCQSGCRYREKVPKSARFVVAAWGRDKPQGVMHQSIKKIRTRFKKSGSKRFVVYVDVILGGTPKISQDLASMNYPAHPLSSQFKSSLPALAAKLAKAL